MYSSYSPLQRRQLREQTYTDTQSTYLLVYAPGRRNALTLSLAEQLHRKFRLVDRLEGELTPSVNGVLLVSEDVECTSTALTYFAAALQQGADLVVCDAVFGFVIHADYFLAAFFFEQFTVKGFYKSLHPVNHGQIVNAVIHTVKGRFGKDTVP